MPTIAEALGSLEQELFVGRAAELAAFEQWLTADTKHPIILNVTGPGGVGKSTLLGAFRRMAAAKGRAVVALDGRDLRARPSELERALTGETAGRRAKTARARQRLVLVDSFEELGSLARDVLDHLISHLEIGARLVVAGRYPLGPAWIEHGWHGRLRVLSLRRFAAAEGRAYLERRGLVEPRFVEQILVATRGHPLAMSLAADLVDQLGVTDFSRLPEWRLVVRSLVEMLLRDVPDLLLRELLEAAAIVRQFDQATLQAVSGRTDIGATFGQLCRLSIVRASAHGLTLHDDARQILVEDLRWRHKERYTELRLRALAYYRERMRTAPPEDREWLLVERLYLWEDAFIQTVTFVDTEPGGIWVHWYRPEDRTDVLRIWTTVVEEQGGPERSVFAAELPRDTLERLLDYRSAMLSLARDADGQALAFGLMLPLCRESVDLLPADGPLLRLAQVYLAPADLDALPATAEASTLLCAFRLAAPPASNPVPPAAQAMLREAGLGFLGRGMSYLVATADPFYKEFVVSLGFERVSAATCEGPDPLHPFDGFVLDLSRIGVEPWIEAIMAGRKPPRVLRAAELEQAVQEALLHWRDDVWLASSALAQSAAVARLAPEHGGGEAVRLAVARALEQARSGAPSEQVLALRALGSAYLSRTGSHQRAAEELAVSRRTFYRLLQRGVHALSQALDAPPT